MIALPGAGELLLILIIIVILFGAGRFSSLGTALGRTVKEIENIPRVIEKEVPEEEWRSEGPDLERIEELRSNLGSLLNPRRLLLRLLNWLVFRLR